ncbi:uncharacterized protein [Pyrus communis]|uniref:uncharacterized protein isoform X1 n=1 Tax=Pyrus communis TaxID=23211 RepID=UPI0035C1FD63
MAAGKVEEAAIPSVNPRSRYIKKRALKNKALAVTFNEKDLSDFVSGFHKRKKKRRKEAEKKQGEARRRKRLELRKQKRNWFLVVGLPKPPIQQLMRLMRVLRSTRMMRLVRPLVLLTPAVDHTIMFTFHWLVLWLVRHRSVSIKALY